MSPYTTYFSDIHSILRYLVLILTLIVAVQSLIGMLGKKEFSATNRKMALFMMIACDIQLLAGLAVFYLYGHILMLKKGIAMETHASRFYTIEHPIGMILGIVLVHMGYNLTKKVMDSDKKLKRLFWYSFVALVIFISQTPWPGKKDGIGRPMFPGMGMAVATTVISPVARNCPNRNSFAQSRRDATYSLFKISKAQLKSRSKLG